MSTGGTAGSSDSGTSDSTVSEPKATLQCIPIAPADVNHDGSVIAGATPLAGATPSQPAVWVNGVVTVIGCPPALAGYRGGASAASNDGSFVIGNCYVTPRINSAFRWTAATGHALLGEQSPQGNFARDVSAGGSVVVGRFPVSRDAGVTVAPVWTQAEGFRMDVPLSFATGVSDDGSVIVGGVGTAGYPDFYRWTAAGGLERLLVSAAINGVVDISGDGRVAVGSMSDPPITTAVRWLPQDPNPEYLPCDTDSCTPLETNADGSIVIGNRWVWDAVHGTRDLMTFGLAYGFSFDENWFLSAVSGDGKVFVGWVLNGSGFILTLPESPARTAEGGTGTASDANPATPSCGGSS